MHLIRNLIDLDKKNCSNFDLGYSRNDNDIDF